MEKLIDKIFVKPNITKSWLKNNGFQYSRVYSNDDEQVYYYKFPVYQYHTYVTLECEIRITLNNGEVSIDIFDSDTKEKYAPFYFEEQEAYEYMVKIINNRVINTLNELGITEINK